VHRHAAKVRVVQDDNPDENALSPQHVRIRLSDGTERTISLPVVYGHPDAALTEAENEEKFFRCCGHAGMPRAQADAVRDLVARVDSLADVTTILSALRPAR
jgi:2-methylcitrate dehydratase PrpD